MRSIELLSPARNLECGIEAIRHGADAVYIGAPRFGARAAAGNSLEDIARLVDYAHLFGVRIYITLNTLLRDDELPAAQALINDLAALHVDALITQDPRILPAGSSPLPCASGLAFGGSPAAPSSSVPVPPAPAGPPSSAFVAPVPAAFPAGSLLSPLPLHSSTQQDNRTPADVLARQASGYQQVVLARELPLEEIRAIHAAAPAMPLEVFVHGALCVSYSGRCYASEYCFGRSANRGECAQFCRLPFDLVDGDGRLVSVPTNATTFTAVSSASPEGHPDSRPLRQRHLLSLRDMNRAADLEALMDAGVSSFKIEGRLKDVAYVKNVTAYYRQRIDAILQRRASDYCRSSFGTSTISFTPDPAKSFNRGFTDYFLHGRTTDLVCPATPKSIGEPVGTIKDLHPSSQSTSPQADRHTAHPSLPQKGSHATSSEDSRRAARFSAQPFSLSVAGSVTFSNGDGLCFFTPDGRLQGFRVNRVDEQGRLYPATMPEGLRKGTPLYRNYDAAFERLLSRPTADRRLAVRWLLEEVPAEEARPKSTPTPTPAVVASPSGEVPLPAFRLTLTTVSGRTASRTFPYPHEAARTPQDAAIRRQLLRLGDTPFSCTEADITLRLSADYFIPASVLAEWRRQLTDALTTPPQANADDGFPAVTTSPVPPSASAPSGSVNGVFAVTPSSTSPLMTCRYCLRHALGQCLKQRHTLHGPLALQLSDGRRFPLQFDCQRCEMHVLRALLLGLLLLFGTTTASLRAAEAERPYGVGYNFYVHADSLLLQEDRPMHWCQGVAQTSDSLWVSGGDHLVVAAITIIPEDCVDSVWVKVARDQGTMGWTHESDLLAAASPDDPISQFIRLFSARHLPWFLACIAVACLAVTVRYLRRRHIPLLHVHDIPSAYPTLLTSALTVATTTYAHIQHYLPEQWVHFYFYPTLNPLAQPAELCLFLLCTWLLLLLTIAVVDAAFSLLPTRSAVVYLLTLLAICTLNYLAISLAAHLTIYLAYALCALYILFAIYHYFRHVRAHYLCGRCGAKLRTKGPCPRCGAIND